MVLILRLGGKRGGKMIAPVAMELSGLKETRGSVSSREEEEEKVKNINFKAYLYCTASSGARVSVM